MFADARKTRSQFVDGVGRSGLGAVSTRIAHLQLEIHVDLLARLQADPKRLALVERDAAALVQRELRVDERALVLDEPGDAVAILVARLLVRLENEDEVAIRPVPFPLVADEIRHESRDHELVVARASRLVVTVFFDELERIRRPVLAARFDDVDVRHEDHRPLCPGTAKLRDEVALERRGLEDVNVLRGEARGPQAFRNGLGRLDGVARPHDGVHLHQLLVDIEGELVVGRAGLGES